jgi:hypothetical protein
MYDKVVECIKNERPDFLIWLLGIKDIKRAGGDQINYYAYLIDKLSQDTSLPCYILANDQDADPTTPDPDNPFGAQVIDRKKLQKLSRNKHADIADRVAEWLNAVHAHALSDDPSGFYYSFNKAKLLETFSGLIIDHFSRPSNKTPRPDKARKFSELLQYFSEATNAAENHNSRMAAAKRRLDQADSAWCDAKRDAADALSRTKATCWIPGVGLGFAIDLAVRESTRSDKYKDYSSAWDAHDTLWKVDTKPMMASFNKSQRCMGHIISGLILSKEYQDKNPQIARLQAVFQKLKGGLRV